MIERVLNNPIIKNLIVEKWRKCQNENDENLNIRYCNPLLINESLCSKICNDSQKPFCRNC